MGDKNVILSFGGLLISLLGEFIRVLAVGFSYEGTSGRETYLRAENVNTTGIYSIVRNPLYIGNYFMFAGVVIAFSNLYALVVFSLFLYLQYYFVILAEEDYLMDKYPEQYTGYCSRVRRIIPVLGSYVKNRNPFNLQKVVFKENDSLFNLLVMFILVLLYKEKSLNGSVSDFTPYIFSGVSILLVYIIIKIIKKKRRPV